MPASPTSPAPPIAPPPPPCSWLYWQVAGKGGDYLHGYVGAWAWTTGDIDHMDTAGTRVSQSTYVFPQPLPCIPAPTKSALPGDIVFYGRPHKHVAMYMGAGQVFDFSGNLPLKPYGFAQIRPINFRPDIDEIRTYPDFLLF